MTTDEIKEKLKTMQDDPLFVTNGMYSPTAADYPDSILPFAEVHLAHLRKNKKVNPAQYLSNLEIMTKKRDKNGSRNK